MARSEIRCAQSRSEIEGVAGREHEIGGLVRGFRVRNVFLRRSIDKLPQQLH